MKLKKKFNLKLNNFNLKEFKFKIVFVCLFVCLFFFVFFFDSYPIVIPVVSNLARNSSSP